MARKPISTRARFEIFKRDGFVCQYCGSTPPSVTLHVDHIHPVAKGGTNDGSNLITSCSACNQGKSDVLLSVVDGSLREKADLIKEREAQIKGYYKVLAAAKKRIENEAWEIAALLSGVDRLDSYDRRRLQSIRNFLEKLHFYAVIDAAEITAAKFGCSPYEKAFKYFCAICWSKIKEGHWHA